MSDPECYLLYPFPHDPPVERVTYSGDMYQVYDTAGAAIAFGDDARARPATSLPGVIMLRAQWFSEGPPTNLARWGVYSEPQRLKMLVGAIGIGGLRRWLRDATIGQPEPSTKPAPWPQEYAGTFSMVGDPAVPPGAAYMLDAGAFASIEKAMALLKAKANEAIYRTISPLRVTLGTTIGSVIPDRDLKIMMGGSEYPVEGTSPDRFMLDDIEAGTYTAADYRLDALAYNLGLRRLPGEPDTILRARAQQRLLDRVIGSSLQKQEQIETAKVSQGKLDLEDDATPAPKQPAVIARAAALEIYDDEDE